ncbi:MAG: hypothetical protein R3176_07595 [Woeseiaceae bacterium]|nr:hypothetical protein [Woeseiaceae bacterium]
MKPGHWIDGLLVAALAAALAGPSPLAAQETDEAEAGSDVISEITVRATRVANTRPAGTYATAATVLRFDPVTELQSRGLPEGQADVTVRGGLFENTGFRVGAVTVMDPQTGHYVAELPIDPALLSPPELLTGIDNALAGFNSNVATVDYALPALTPGGAVQAGAGSDDLRFGLLRAAGIVSRGDGAEVAVAASAAGSSGDGTVDNGDHEFARYNLQLQRRGRATQSDLLVAYQDKLYGWPGAYTGFASLAETDDTQTTLALVNHRAELDSGWWQLGAFYRRLVDDYDFDRTTSESGAPGSFDHETRVWGLGLDGTFDGAGLQWDFAGQLTADELVRSTDLTNSDFTSRSYASLSLVPARRIERPSGRSVTFRFGGTLDASNRDASAFSPVLGMTVEETLPDGTRHVTLEYAATSQLPGYTVLGSGPSGLFGGNPDLGREKARQLLLSVGQQAFDWRGTITVFYRADDDLVDWTFSSDSPFARQANPVDIDVFGVELLYSSTFGPARVSIGYTWLDKEADYGEADVDASFYALNFARHRATLALRYRLPRSLELRLDTEYREQEENALRASSDTAVVVAASLGWQHANGFGVALIADNLTDDDYQQFPGTPAVGRQVSLRARYEW